MLRELGKTMKKLTRYQQRRKQGLCGWCDKRALKGKSQCSHHVKYFRELRQSAEYRRKAKATYQEQRPSYVGSSQKTGITGAIGELRVAAHFLEKGWEVFRSLSSTCSCDLIIMRGKRKQRVEVRTGWKLRNGACRFSKRRVRADIVAVVLRDSIVYKRWRKQ